MKTNLLEIPHFHFERVDSTNDVAKELIGNNELFIVTANEQYAGKGRKGRQWVGNSFQNVYFSLAVDETKNSFIKNKHMYQIIGCLAVKATLLEFVEDQDIKLKYPNDVYIRNNSGDYRKVSGILSEHSYSGNTCTESILGIGININQTKFADDLEQKATSLKILGFEIDNDLVVQKLISKLDYYFNGNENEIFDEWIKELNIIGKEIINVSNGKVYIVNSIDKNGTINAKNESEEININNGDSVIYDLG